MKLKVRFNNDVRRIQMPANEGDLSVDTLKDQVAQLYDLESVQFGLKYQDEDEDWCTITCDEELQEAIRLSDGKVLRLTVTENDWSLKSFMVDDNEQGSSSNTTTPSTGTGTGSALSHHGTGGNNTSDQDAEKAKAKAKAEAEAAEKKKKLAGLAKQRQEALNSQKEHMKTLKELSSQLAEHSKDADKYTIQVKEFKDKETMLASRLADDQKRTQALKTEIHKLEKKLEEMKVQYKETLDSVTQTDLEKTQISEKLFKSMEAYKESNAKFTQTKTEIATAKELADKASNKIAEIEDEMERVESGKGESTTSSSTSSTTSNTTSNNTNTSTTTTTTQPAGNDDDETSISAFVRACVKCGESFNEDEQTCDFHCSTSGEIVEVTALVGECQHCQLDASASTEIFGGKCIHTVF